MNRLGIITGLQSEARCLSQFPTDQRPTILCSGANAARARSAAHELIAGGCDALVSFGIAGGLTPGLGTGVLVIAETIIAPDGRRYDTNAAWRSSVGAAAVNKLDIRIGNLVGSDEAITTLDGKRRLWEASGAVAVDMESHAVAGAAAERQVPFLALRVVADSHDRVLPSWVGKGVNKNGSLRLGVIVKEVISAPGEFPDLVRLGLENRRALGVLSRVATLIGPRLGLDQVFG